MSQQDNTIAICPVPVINSILGRKNSLEEIDDDNQVSVPITTSGLVESMTYPSSAFLDTLTIYNNHTEFTLIRMQIYLIISAKGN